MNEENRIPAKGKLLISEPFLLDPNFKRTIILLGEHTDEGSICFILNKPTDLKLHCILEDFPEFDAPVFYGGPVQVNSLQFIHRTNALLEDSIKIMDGLYWGGNFELLKIYIQSGEVEPEDFRFFIGYSGWGAGQLEDEIAINSWLLTNSSTDNIFSIEPDKLWTDVLKGMGKKFA